jgi:hypothetical protein
MKNFEQNNIKPYTKAIIRLLNRGVVESNATVWDDITKNYQIEIQEYLAQIGVELIVKKDEGFAFLKQLEDNEENTLGLITRRQMGYETSVVLVVLRQSLEEFDSNPTSFQGTQKFITNTEIKEQVELFLSEGYNKSKFQKELDTCINKIVELGYLKEMSKKDNETKYQIHRIIKEKVTLDILNEFKTKLQNYVQSI